MAIWEGGHVFWRLCPCWSRQSETIVGMNTFSTPGLDEGHRKRRHLRFRLPWMMLGVLRRLDILLQL